ncbi:MAG: VWA domain-containing protein [Aequoribacter sp.]|uniref:VWA domain-containing protein n=1 Tax=Aequoribacter sp. TaxID=2847771 RepID=UPI003C67B596
MMVEFSHPWWLLALVLIPVLPHLPAWSKVHDTLWFPATDRAIQSLPNIKAVRKLSAWFYAQVWLGLALLIVGLANPVYTVKEQFKGLAGRDIMLVLDTSQSMEIADIESQSGQTVALSRLDAVKQGVMSLLDASQGNRIGLIAFGEQSFVMSDLTAYGDTVRYMVSQLETGFAGDSTRFGDGVGYAVSLLADVDSERALVVLITDGNDTGSDLPPVEAARLAKALDVKLYVAAVGAIVSTDREPIDEALLRRLAERTGGEFFRIAQVIDFDAMWQTLEDLEPKQERVSERVKRIPLSWIAWVASFWLFVFAAFWATRPQEGEGR